MISCPSRVLAFGTRSIVTRNRHRSIHGTRRWMGRPPLPEHPPGELYLENNQSDLPNIDLDRLRKTAAAIQTIVGYHSYDLSLYLVDDAAMQNINGESRGMFRGTDILSFPFAEAVEPGVLEPPDFDIPDYYNLGDIVVDVPYVQAACRADREDQQREASDLRQSRTMEGADDDEEDRGVSGAMATVEDPEKRIQMLLVHGILHLIGYDHIDDDDYELMVTREEEILKELDLLE